MPEMSDLCYLGKTQNVCLGMVLALLSRTRKFPNHTLNFWCHIQQPQMPTVATLDGIQGKSAITFSYLTFSTQSSPRKTYFLDVQHTVIAYP